MIDSAVEVCGDLIVGINGQQIGTPFDFYNVIDGCKASFKTRGTDFWHRM
jgi:hypothetical protein